MSNAWSQQIDSLKTSNYLEDQIYVGLSYITLSENPVGVGQNGFSNSFGIGFIKDFPFSAQGNLAVGAGLGYGRNTYYQNIRINENLEGNTFEILPAATVYKNNKFSTHVIDLPIELRWRTSTIDKYKFWRIYTGIKFSYVFSSNAKFQGESETETIRIKGIQDINQWQSGATLSVGYGTWTFNVYYGLSTIFKNAYLENLQPLGSKEFRMGLIFYIL